MSVWKWLSTSAGKAKTCLSVFWQKCVHNCLLLYDYNCYHLLLLFMCLCVRARVPWRRHSWISQMTTLGCHFFLSAILAFRLPCRATGTLTWGSDLTGLGNWWTAFRCVCTLCLPARVEWECLLLHVICSHLVLSNSGVFNTCVELFHLVFLSLTI